MKGLKKLWRKLRYTHYMTGCLGGYCFRISNFGFAWYNAGESWDALTEHGDDPGCPVSAAKEEISYWC